jgi:Holliday junction resolvase RusA-like endonuclease
MNIVINIKPVTKKNSQRIIIVRGRPMIIPSKLYKDYEKDCSAYLKPLETPIDYPINLKCLFFMSTKRKIDLCNLQEAICDILVHYGILADDNRNIVAAQDGSRVYYDKENPRTEIEITPLDNYEQW